MNKLQGYTRAKLGDSSLTCGCANPISPGRHDEIKKNWCCLLCVIICVRRLKLGRGCVMQLDNDLKRTSKSTSECLNSKIITIPDWHQNLDHDLFKLLWQDKSKVQKPSWTEAMLWIRLAKITTVVWGFIACFCINKNIKCIKCSFIWLWVPNAKILQRCWLDPWK